MSAWVWVWVAAALVLTGAVLVVLKWLARITWPWWVVLLPFLPLVAGFVLALVALNSLMSNGWH